MKRKIDPVLEDAVKYRTTRPRSPRDADMGTETARPAPAGAPREIADLPPRLRKPAKPPPSRRPDVEKSHDPAGYPHGR